MANRLENMPNIRVKNIDQTIKFLTTIFQTLRIIFKYFQKHPVYNFQAYQLLKGHIPSG